MPFKILLTSFTTWLPHHKSNASDDLLEIISQLYSGEQLIFLRKLPVDFQIAPKKVIAKLNQVQPDAIICCGMAESRDKLTVESRAFNGLEMIKTTVNLDHLVAELKATDISDNAGGFVCERLYYETLKYIRDRLLTTKCIFLHIPPLTPQNSEIITSDFLAIIRRLKYC
ncbi:MAG: peptidase C15 [Oscillatoriaceae bacterium SKW80]|nr:peptidase C15 [Oscillatoriaceae bacterium SKYG93]MCX8122064.1 peptidase C15 [Oscillatoriaceae bacterium SKW80]MDW8454351.1 peptidase C15 [Oscillatoriaceae cyanobacterium SKYGB_i_bin93]HIK29216.1 peptidase C15 [Oscillatoriaceae cyanobacterium M7585_C2015_266]